MNPCDYDLFAKVKEPLRETRHNTRYEFIHAIGLSMTACLVYWLARLTAVQEVPGSIPGYTPEIFLEVKGLEGGPPSLVRTIG